MKIFLKLNFCLIIILAGCSPGLNNQNVDQLINEVLSFACDNSYRAYLQKQIQNQRAILTDQQMIKSLQNMKQDIKCN